MSKLWARPRISLYSEYMYPHPLWRLDGVGPKLEELSGDLQRAVNQWDTLFQDYFSVEGWTDAVARDKYVSRASDLRRRTQVEVGLDYRVLVDLWPWKSGALIAPDPLVLRSERGRSPRDQLNGVTVSPAVCSALAQWDRLFQDHHVVGSDWEDRDARAEYEHRIPEVMRQLQAEIGMEVDVMVDAWPLPVSGEDHDGSLPGWPGVFG